MEKTGVAPGTAIYTGNLVPKKPDITLARFGPETLQIDEVHSSDPLIKLVEPISGTLKSWFHIEPISDQETIIKLCSDFGLHVLVTEDILSVNHRPKVDEYDNYLFIIIKYVVYKKNDLNFYQVAFVLKDNLILSFADKSPHRFAGIQKRLQKVDSRLRKGDISYMLFALIDYIVDHYFDVLEKIGEEIEELEDEILYNPTKKSIEHVHNLKRNLIELKKNVWPMREVINTLLQSDLIKSEHHVYFKDIYDHIIDIIDIIEGYGDRVSGFLDIYLSTLSNRMNEIMKTLSMIATIFIPLSFLTGYFGMNFKYETVLNSQNAYLGTNILMIVLPILLLVYFKVRKWF